MFTQEWPTVLKVKPVGCVCDSMEGVFSLVKCADSSMFNILK